MDTTNAGRKVMKYFFDTNIILILFQGRDDEIRTNVKNILTDEGNSFYISTISLLEIAQLCRKRRIDGVDYESEKFDDGEKIIKHILKELPIINILPFEEKDALIAARLKFVSNHNDPNDLAIIGHSIGVGMPLISCDDKFPFYEAQGAKVIHNPR